MQRLFSTFPDSVRPTSANVTEVSYIDSVRFLGQGSPVETDENVDVVRLPFFMPQFP